MGSWATLFLLAGASVASFACEGIASIDRIAYNDAAANGGGDAADGGQSPENQDVDASDASDASPIRPDAAGDACTPGTCGSPTCGDSGACPSLFECNTSTCSSPCSFDGRTGPCAAGTPNYWSCTGQPGNFAKCVPATAPVGVAYCCP